MKFKEQLGKHTRISGNGQAGTTSRHIIGTEQYKTAAQMMQILIDRGLV